MMTAHFNARLYRESTSGAKGVIKGLYGAVAPIHYGLEWQHKHFKVGKVGKPAYRCSLQVNCGRN